MFDPFGGDDFIGSLFGFTSTLEDDILGFLNDLLTGVVAAFRVVFAALLAAVSAVWKGISATGKFLLHLWEGGIKGLLDKIVRGISAVIDYVEKLLAPIVRFLKRVRQIWDQVFKLYIKPYLNLLQKIRQYLLLLRLLHVKLAQKLDDRIVASEQLISSIFLQVRGYLNLALDTLNSLTDPRSLARLVLVGVAGRQVAAATVRIFTGLPIGFFFPNFAASAAPWERPVQGGADLADPRRNPSPSALLSGLADLPASYFAPPDPIPTDGALDEVGDSYIGATLIDQLLASAADLEAIEDDPLSIVAVVRDESGFSYDAGVAGATALLGV